MQFSKITLSALLVGLASTALAVPVPEATPSSLEAASTPAPEATPNLETVTFTGKKVEGHLVTEPAPETPDSQGLQKRADSQGLEKRAAKARVFAHGGSDIISALADSAVQFAEGLIRNLSNWNSVYLPSPSLSYYHYFY